MRGMCGGLRRKAIALPLALVSLALFPTGASAVADVIRNSGNAFDQPTYNSNVGDLVQFEHTGGAPHDVTSTQSLFSSATISSGTTPVNGTQFLTPGTYPFICTIHPETMQASLIVSENGIPPPPPPQRTLTVTLSGSGTGTVTGPGISCPGNCTESYADGILVTLNAAGTGGSTFAGWGGACAGTGSCQLTMDADKAVTAGFTAPSAPDGTTPDGTTPSGTTPVARPDIELKIVSRKLDKVVAKGKLVLEVQALTKSDDVSVAAQLGKKALGERTDLDLAAGQSLKIALKLKQGVRRKLAALNKAKVTAEATVPFGEPDVARRVLK